MKFLSKLTISYLWICKHYNSYKLRKKILFDIKGEVFNNLYISSWYSVLKKRKEILDTAFEHFSTLSLASKANLNCEELNPVQDWMTKQEKILSVVTTSKCNKMRSEARDDLAKEKEWFKISDCKVFIEKREKRFEEFNKNQELPKWFKWPSEEERKKFLIEEIETCEIWYALQNWCDLLSDESKKQKCEKFKELRNEKYKLEQFMSFQKEDYIR